MLKTDFFRALVIGALVPWLVLFCASRTMSPEIVAELNPEEEYEEKSDPVFMRLLLPDGTVQQMEMNAYLTGVVLGEMPASFSDEALKAQAIAARTYTAKALLTGGKHGDGSVCTEYSCCQAYCSQEDYLSSGGTPEDLDKIGMAVGDTGTKVICYGDSLIEAVFFACSGGRTEDAVAVWGMDYPYLVSVDSPGEEEASLFHSVREYTIPEFEACIGRNLSGSPISWFGETSYTDGGGVESTVIAGEEYSGTALRRLLGLNSTAFSVTPGLGGVTIESWGCGHRVGMSQFGANAMACSGYPCEEILAHYYPGTELREMDWIK